MAKKPAANDGQCLTPGTLRSLRAHLRERAHADESPQDHLRFNQAHRAQTTRLANVVSHELARDFHLHAAWIQDPAHAELAFQTLKFIPCIPSGKAPFAKAVQLTDQLDAWDDKVNPFHEGWSNTHANPCLSRRRWGWARADV